MTVPTHPTPAECPVCGAAVPRGAKACPECGADERTGWNEEMTAYDGIELPESAFADESSPPVRKNGLMRPAVVAVVAILLLIAFLVRFL